MAKGLRVGLPITTISISVLLIVFGWNIKTASTAVSDVIYETETQEIATNKVEKVDIESGEVNIEIEKVDIVSSSIEETEEIELTAEEQEWLNYIMPNVKTSLNVRTEPNESANLVGKLRKGDMATVLEVGEEWTKIQSGNLVGYVKNEYCIYGLEALEYAKENFDTLGTGLTIEEIEAIEKSKENQNQEMELPKTDDLNEESEEITEIIENIETQKPESITGNNDSVEQSDSTTSVDDLTLLTALIYCEAGGEPYETQLAVAAVVMNRVKSSSFPNTIYEVIYQPGQFSPASSGRLQERLDSEKVSQSCLEAAKAAMAGEDNTNGCLYFNDMTSGKTGLQIGNMVFW